MKQATRYSIRISLVLVLILFLPPLNIFFKSIKLDTHSSFTSARGLPVLVKITNTDSETIEFADFDSQVVRFMNRWGVVGASLAVAHEGKLVYAKGYGYANREEQIATEPYHLFRIASVSKLITAVAVLKLAEWGRLSLDSKVFGESGILTDSIYTGYLDKRVEQVTVRMLLDHSGGWTTHWGDQLFMHESIARQQGIELPVSKDDIIRFVLSKRMHFNPGAQSSYNNFGYLLAERVIEVASGMPYELFVQDVLFAPLEVFDAHIAQNYDSLRYRNEVRYYEVPEAVPVPAFDGSPQMVLKSRGGNDVRTLGGAGAWVISPISLLRFVMALERREDSPLLRSNSIDLLAQKDAGFSPLGWKNVLSNGNKLRTGSFAGSSAMVQSRADGLQYVFLVNCSPWTGAKFPYEVDRFMSKSFQRMDGLPDRDLLKPNERQYTLPFSPWQFVLPLGSMGLGRTDTLYIN